MPHRSGVCCVSSEYTESGLCVYLHCKSQKECSKRFFLERYSLNLKVHVQHPFILRGACIKKLELLRMEV